MIDGLIIAEIRHRKAQKFRDIKKLNSSHYVFYQCPYCKYEKLLISSAAKCHGLNSVDLKIRKLLCKCGQNSMAFKSILLGSVSKNGIDVIFRVALDSSNQDHIAEKFAQKPDSKFVHILNDHLREEQGYREKTELFSQYLDFLVVHLVDQLPIVKGGIKAKIAGSDKDILEISIDNSFEGSDSFYQKELKNLLVEVFMCKEALINYSLIGLNKIVLVLNDIQKFTDFYITDLYKTNYLDDRFNDIVSRYENIEENIIKDFIILDTETQLSKDDVGGWFPEKMKLSLAVTFDLTYGYRTWYEKDVNELVNELISFDKIIGFNLLDFDYRVIARYNSKTDIVKSKSFDILDYLYRKLGFRIKLDDIAKSTLNKSKSGDGLNAVHLWKNGKKDLVEEYCENDVQLIKEIYEFGYKNCHIFYPSKNGKQKVEVNWSVSTTPITSSKIDFIIDAIFRISNIDHIEIIENKSVIIKTTKLSLSSEEIQITVKRSHNDPVLYATVTVILNDHAVSEDILKDSLYEILQRVNMLDNKLNIKLDIIFNDRDVYLKDGKLIIN